jgi:hypothetical protein
MAGSSPARHQIGEVALDPFGHPHVQASGEQDDRIDGHAGDQPDDRDWTERGCRGAGDEEEQRGQPDEDAADGDEDRSERRSWARSRAVR